MSQLDANARRMVQLFSRMRNDRVGPGFQLLKQLNLSFSHLRALQLLEDGRPLSMKELAEQLQMTPPSVTALTRRLVQTGLVQRSAHAGDSRVALISLTDAGRHLHTQVAQEHIERMTELLAGLDEADQQQFLDLLERAIRALEVRGPLAIWREPSPDEVPGETATSGTPGAVAEPN